jgi:PAS domain S-box-containing protein
MPEGKSREDLMKDYRELQLRVTRFSSIEQELINTRDRLDHELELYRRLYKYNSLALSAKSYEQFYHLLCEATVDVFEVEGAFIFLREYGTEARFTVYKEGLKIQNSLEEIVREIEGFKNNFAAQKSHVLDEDTLAKSEVFQKYSRGILSYFVDESLGFEVLVIGLISKSSEQLYAPMNERKVTLFGVFMQQLEALVSNRRKSDQIATQIATIRKSEDELRKLSLIATKSKSGVIITDTFGRIEWVNDAFENISGYELEEVVGKKPKDFLQGKSSEDEARMKLKEALGKKEDVEVTIVNYNKAGNPYYNNLEIISVFNEFGEHTNFIALQKDITNETEFKKELVKINSRFELIANQSKIGIWEYDAYSKNVVWSQVLFDIYGISPTEWTGDLYASWKEAMHEDDRAAVFVGIEELLHGLKESVESEFRIIRKSDGAMRINKSLTVAEKNEKGEVTRLVGSSQDITELKNAQELMASNNVELKKINSELDNFVYSISHDLRSPLLSIKGIISLIIHSEGLDASTIELLEMADSSVTRLDGTIQEILEYSRNSRLNVDRENFNIDEMVQTIFNDLKFSNKEPFEFDVIFETNREVYSDKARVAILLKNIIGNSVKYRREGIVSKIEFKMTRKNGNVIIHVKDNGEGISDENLSKIFNMFFRGTTASVGTGLGLYICKEIVAKLGGEISVNSELGVGTTLTIALPELKTE